MTKKVSRIVKTADDDPKHIVYFACWTIESARNIQRLIADKTGLICGIGKIKRGVELEKVC